MARFRMTVIGNFYGSTVKPGDTIIVEASSESNINAVMVREAVEQQLGKTMNELPGYGRLREKWKITQI